MNRLNSTVRIVLLTAVLSSFLSCLLMVARGLAHSDPPTDRNARGDRSSTSRRRSSRLFPPRRPAGLRVILKPAPCVGELRESPAIRGRRRGRSGEEPHCGTRRAPGVLPWACGRSSPVRIPPLRRRPRVGRQPAEGRAACEPGSAPSASQGDRTRAWRTRFSRPLDASWDLWGPGKGRP